VNQSTRRVVDESVDFICHLVRGVEHGEIAMIAHAPR
jgi:hypothetical protein